MLDNIYNCFHGKIFRVIVSVCVIGIGALLVEYMNDGTICNRAFNGPSIATVLMLSANIIISVYDILNGGNVRIMLEVFNNVSRIAMVFLFTFFTYDSAKFELSKTNLSE